MKRHSGEELTPREQEVIGLLSTGLTNEEIARQLGISLDGVKYHVSGILRRLRVENRHEAASLHLGTEGGVLTPREQEVIELLSTGLTNDEIARQLGISLDGVKYHVSGILRRLRVDSRHEAASLHLRTEGSGRFAAWAPVIFLRKLPFAWLPKAAAGAVLTTAAAGIALLAWGVMSTSSDAVTTTSPTGCGAEQTAGSAPNCGPRVAPAAAGAGADAISAISAGLYHSCALKGGGVWCWGGYYIGDGISAGSPMPRGVPGLSSGVSAISSGRESCALKDGGVWCWGGFRIAVGVPVSVLGLTSDVSAISAGRNDACALKEGGVWCWSPDSDEAVAVAGLESGVSAISGLCALKDGGVWCWSGGIHAGVPAVAVPGLASGVSAISTGAGGDNSCALKDGGAWCWAGGTVPVAVSGLASGVSAISAGYYHTCAVKDGGAWCWGRNIDGELGDNSTTNSPVPVAVSGLGSSVSAINAGEDHSCALKEGGIWCWGNNSEGQLGNNSTTDSAMPVAVLFSPASAGDIAAAPGGQPSPTPPSAGDIAAAPGGQPSPAPPSAGDIAAAPDGTPLPAPPSAGDIAAAPGGQPSPTPPNAGDIAAAPDGTPLPAQPSADSANHHAAYVLGGTAAAALAILAAGMWAVRRRRPWRNKGA